MSVTLKITDFTHEQYHKIRSMGFEWKEEIYHSNILQKEPYGNFKKNQEQIARTVSGFEYYKKGLGKGFLIRHFNTVDLLIEFLEKPKCDHYTYLPNEFYSLDTMVCQKCEEKIDVQIHCRINGIPHYTDKFKSGDRVKSETSGIGTIINKDGHCGGHNRTFYRVKLDQTKNMSPYSCLYCSEQSLTKIGETEKKMICQAHEWRRLSNLPDPIDWCQNCGTVSIGGGSDWVPKMLNQEPAKFMTKKELDERQTMFSA